MGGDSKRSSKRGADKKSLLERLQFLEELKGFQDQLGKVIRIYTSNPAFTTERCLKEIVGFIARKFDLYAVSIYLLNEPFHDLSLYVYVSREAVDAEKGSFDITPGQGIIGHCARTGEMMLVEDVTSDPRWLRGPFPATRSELSVPIRIKQRVVGVLDVQEPTPKRMTQEFSMLIQDIATSIAFVLETKQLYDELKGYSEQLERKVSEKVGELKSTEERYRVIVENAADPIFTADLDGRFTWVNRATRERLGYAAEEIIGMHVSRVVKKGHLHKVHAALQQALEGQGTRHPIELELLTKSGEERTVEFSCVPVLEEGRITGVEAGLRDITDRTVIEKLRKTYLKTLEEAVIERTAEIKEMQRASILAIATLAESIDEDTGGHLERIRHYCRTLAEDLRKNSPYQEAFTDEYCELVYDLSPLHDLGKVGIRDYILQKPDKLTTDEYARMKDHAEIGARALRMAGQMIHRESIFSIAEMIARFHHEKWDGSGYPAVEIDKEHRPLKGEEIPLCARIVALADVYDALTSKRPYKEPFPHEKARDIISAESGKHFDPEIVKSFLRCEQDFINIRKRFPDKQAAEARPFEIPATPEKE